MISLSRMKSTAGARRRRRSRKEAVARPPPSSHEAMLFRDIKTRKHAAGDLAQMKGVGGDTDFSGARPAVSRRVIMLS